MVTDFSVIKDVIVDNLRVGPNGITDDVNVVNGVIRQDCVGRIATEVSLKLNQFDTIIAQKQMGSLPESNFTLKAGEPVYVSFPVAGNPDDQPATIRRASVALSEDNTWTRMAVNNLFADGIMTKGGFITDDGARAYTYGSYTGSGLALVQPFYFVDPYTGTGSTFTVEYFWRQGLQLRRR